MKPNFKYIQVQGLKANSEPFWVENKTFHIKYGELVALEGIFSTKLYHSLVRVIRRTNNKPLKGVPTFFVVAVATQFPVADNVQVVACDHVAPAPDSISLIKHELAAAKDEIANAEARIEKLQGLINNVAAS